MDDATPTGTRPLRVLRLIFRIVFALALVVLLVLIGVKQAPKVLAAMASTTPTTTIAAGASTVPTAAEPSVSTTPLPTVSVPTISLPPVSDGGGSSGGGSTGGGSSDGGGSASKPATQHPVVTSLSAANVSCPIQPTDAPGASTVPTPQVTVRWSTSGGTKAWFGVQTSDAEAAPYAEEPLSGAITLNYPCTEATQLYTVTVQGTSGKVSRSITVRNTGHIG